MKSKLLPTLLVVIILLNGVLIFMLVKKTHQNKKHPSERNFLTDQLKFSENQHKQFKNLDDIHRSSMSILDKKIRIQKDILFNSFADNNINIDSLTKIIGSFEGEKELEVFRFFKSVRTLCTSDQQKKFDIIINKAIKGSKPRPPSNGGNHPPRGGGISPPR